MQCTAQPEGLWHEVKAHLRLHVLPLVPPVWVAHGLAFAQVEDAPAEVRVRFGPVADILDAPIHRGPHMEVSKRECLIRLGSWARISARMGKEIVVDAGPNADANLLAGWVLGLTTVAILYQRGLTPLHASAVVLSGRGVAFVGPSGAGKSSLAAACVGSGARFLTDDVLVVARSSDGTLVGHAGPPILRLSPDTAEGLALQGFAVIGTARKEKLLLRSSEEPLESPVPIAAAFILTRGKAIDAVRLGNIKLLSHLRGLVQRPGLSRLIGNEAAMFENLGSLTRAVPIWQLVLPGEGWNLPRCVSAVKRIMAGNGISQKE